MKLQFTVPGLPRPKERPRFGRGRVYTPTTTVAYEYEIWVLAQGAGARQDCLKGVPVAVHILAFMGPTIEQLLHADVDNIAKAVLDGMKPAFNDKYVTRLQIDKVVSYEQKLIVTIETRDEVVCEHSYSSDCLLCATDRVTTKADPL